MIVDLNFVDEPSKKKLFALLRRMIEMSVTNPDQPLEKEEKKKEEVWKPYMELLNYITSKIGNMLH